MTQAQPAGQVLHSFFADHLITVKGMSPASVRSYRDTIRLFICFTAADKGCKITRLTLGDLTYDQVVRFLRHLEHDRDNHIRTRNQRLAALHTLFEYIAGRSPEMLAACQQVAAIPMKRAAPPETRFLERDEVEELLRRMPRDGRHALRDRALLLFLYNTGLFSGGPRVAAVALSPVCAAQKLLYVMLPCATGVVQVATGVSWWCCC